MKETLDRFDKAIYEFEKKVVGGMTLLMAAVVFLDVVHRVFSRRPGRLAVLLGGWFDAHPEPLDDFVAPGISVVFALLIVYGALKGRAEARAVDVPKWKNMLGAVVITAGVSLLIELVLILRPEGFVFAPYLALSALLWSGLIGGSMATYASKHLALEMGEKIWPESLRPKVRSFSQMLAGLFAALLAILGALSAYDHFLAWRESPEAALIPSVDIPKWIVFLVIPYAFGMISLRFLGRAFGILTTREQVGDVPLPKAPTEEPAS